MNSVVLHHLSSLIPAVLLFCSCLAAGMCMRFRTDRENTVSEKTGKRLKAAGMASWIIGLLSGVAFLVAALAAGSTGEEIAALFGIACAVFLTASCAGTGKNNAVLSLLPFVLLTLQKTGEGIG